VGAGSLLSACGAGGDPASSSKPIRVGMLTDITGAIGFYGKAASNTAKLWIERQNAAGGLLGRQLQLVLEDSASDPSVGASKAKKMVQQNNVDVVVGGISSAMREAIKGQLIGRGGKLYFYPQLYEGGECEKYLYCTGPVPPQQVDPLIAYLAQQGGSRYYLPGADYVWPHQVNKQVAKAVAANGGTVTGEEYFPLDNTDYSKAVSDIMSNGTDVIFTTIVPPGAWNFFQQLSDRGYQKQGGKVVCVWVDETAFSAVQPQYIQGLISCLDYFKGVSDPFSEKLYKEYAAKFGSSGSLSASGTAGVWRALGLWGDAVARSKSLDRDEVAEALNTSKLDQALGGPTAMAPGENHCVMNLYVGEVQGKEMKVIETLSSVEPAQGCDL